jgi:hypothetical protein
MWFTPPCIIDWWISLEAAILDEAPTSFASSLLVIVMNAPVVVCAATVPLTHASFTVTSAATLSDAQAAMSHAVLM